MVHQKKCNLIEQMELMTFNLFIPFYTLFSSGKDNEKQVDAKKFGDEITEHVSNTVNLSTHK